MLPLRMPSSESIEFKTNLYADLNVYRLAILHSGLKAPLLHCLNRSCVQSKSQAPYHANIPRMPLLIDNQPKHACSLRLGVAGFLGIFGIRSCNRLRSRYSSADLKYASAYSASAACTHARTVPHSDSAAGSRANAAARTNSIRRRSRRKRRGHRIAEVRHVIIGQLYLRNNHRRLNCELGMFVVNNYLWRRDLLRRKFWQSSFSCRQPV